MSAFRKAAAVGVVAWGLAVFPLAAQTSNTAGLAESNTSKATAGIFGTDVDDFMSVTGWSGVKPQRAFLGLGTDGQRLGLGFAKTLGSLYLGAYYNGSFLQGGGEDKVQVSKTSVYDGTSSLWSSTTTTEYYSNDDDEPTRSDNSIAVLFGLGGNMGLKVVFAETLDTRSAPYGMPYNGTIIESADGTKVVSGIVSDYSYLTGTMTPQLEWGMQVGLGGLTLKPRVALAFGIQNDSVSWTSEGKTTVNGVQSDEAKTEKTGRGTYYVGSEDTYYNAGYMAPQVEVGADIEKSLWGGTLYAGLAYGLDLHIYANPIDADGSTASGWTSFTETSSTTNGGDTKYESTERTSSFREHSYIAHTIPLSATWTIDVGERVSLGAGLGLDFGIKSELSGQTEKTTWKKFTNTPLDSVSSLAGDATAYESTEVSYSGWDTTTGTFDLTPSVSLGAKVYVIPSKLRLNFGLAMNPFQYTSVTTTTAPTKIGSETVKIVDGNGNVTETTEVDSNGGSDTAVSTQTFSETWTTFRAGLSAGLSFEMGGFTLDASVTPTTTDTGMGGFSVNPWQTFVDGDYSFIVSYKF